MGDGTAVSPVHRKMHRISKKRSKAVNKLSNYAAATAVKIVAIKELKVKENGLGGHMLF